MTLSILVIVTAVNAIQLNASQLQTPRIEQDTALAIKPPLKSGSKRMLR